MNTHLTYYDAGISLSSSIVPLPRDLIELLPPHLRKGANEKLLGQNFTGSTRTRVRDILNLFSQLPEALQLSDNFNKISVFIGEVYGGDTILENLLCFKP